LLGAQAVRDRRAKRVVQVETKTSGKREGRRPDRATEKLRIRPFLFGGGQSSTVPPGCGGKTSGGNGSVSWGCSRGARGGRECSGAKERTGDKDGLAVGTAGRRFGGWRRGNGDGLVEAEAELGARERKPLSMSRVMEAVITDFDEALGQDVLEEAMQELEGGQGHFA